MNVIFLMPKQRPGVGAVTEAVTARSIKIDQIHLFQLYLGCYGLAGHFPGLWVAIPLSQRSRKPISQGVKSELNERK